jgi:SNF2 family DNA or RNA helicase
MTSELSVSYDAGRRLATLTLIGDTHAWSAVRRICEDRSEQTAVTGPASLTLPWWAFLGCRSELAYQARRRPFSIRLEPSAELRVARAEEIANRYQTAVSAARASAEGIGALLVERGFKRQLTPEQLRNVAHLYELPSGATFSVPGAGKTTEALALFALKRDKDSRLIIVCPKNAFPAWEEQLALCLEENTFVRLRGGNLAIETALGQMPTKVLITYQQLPNVIDLLSAYMEQDGSFVFLDESHRIKRGYRGVIGNCILSFAEIPHTKLIMSGTPMPNDISDLVPQFNFLFPEITTDEDSVEECIKPVYVRTTKKELNLPPKPEKIVQIPLRPAQFELYELLRSEAARQASQRGFNVRDRMRLRKAGQSALRMLQLVTNPALLARLPFEHPDLLSEVLAEGDSPKLQYACLRARQLAFEGKKSIIWSSFVDNVELVAQRLIDLGAEYIHGGVDAGDENEEGTREQKVKRFHESKDCFVLVANPAACGEGISLHTVCHDAIYLDRNYNAAQYLQSEDRIHRLGLRPDQITYVEILHAPGTVDDSVRRRLTTKIANMARVLDDPSLIVEPEVVDLDAEGFNSQDFEDFLGHLRGKRAS